MAGCAALVLATPLQAGPSDVDSDAEFQAQSRHIASLQKIINSLHKRQFDLEERVESLGSMREEIGKLNEQLSLLRSEIGELRVDVQGISREFTEYRTDYRKFARIKAVGEKIPTLVSATGKTYEAVLIRRVTDTGLDIRHSRGSTRLRYDQLPADYRGRFQWDRAVAEAAFAQEEKDEILRERLNIIVQRQDEQKKEAAAAAAAAATEKRLKDLENRLASRTSEKAFISRLGSSGKLGERRSVGGRTSSRYRADRYDSRPTIYYYNTHRHSGVRSPTPSSHCPSHSPRPVPRITIPTRWPNGRD